MTNVRNALKVFILIKIGNVFQYHPYADNMMKIVDFVHLVMLDTYYHNNLMVTV